MRLTFVAVIATALLGCAFAAIAGDEVHSLPLWNAPLPSKQYSGYLTIDAAHGRELHYWFVESENSPKDDPVILWLNGGPGCSSLDGFWSENGPLHVRVNASNGPEVYRNDHTWAQLANMLYLEAPAGVGFSFSKTPHDYYTNDTKTANDNFVALQQFFKNYPEYADHDFYISGESYAGVYVPTLAARVLEGNKNKESDIKLKGILVGNGCTGTEVGICGRDGTPIEVDYLHAHGLFSNNLYAKIQNTCGDFKNPSSECEALLNQMSKEVGPVDVYDIYAPCIMGPSPYHKMQLEHMTSRKIGGPDGCIDSIAMHMYFNRPDVQQAINVISASEYFKEWFVCSSKLHYTPTAKNLPRDTYPTLVENIRVLIFNGDVDACVPYTDNEAWTSGMGYPVSTPWRPWLVNQQVAGYWTEYTTPGSGSFGFLTVKGAGHMVPQYKPEQAFIMLQRYLKNQPF